MSKKAKDITVGETVFNRGQKLYRQRGPRRCGTSLDRRPFLDTEGIWHGWYHPDEYLGVGP